MRKFGLYAVTLVALVAAGVAYSAASPSAKLQKQDRVYGSCRSHGKQEVKQDTGPATKVRSP